MTAEEFWDKYLNINILDFFDDACDFFGKKLPEGFTEDYDVGEVILETKGKQETAKNFDNVLKFTEILLNKQPELYKEYFHYFDDFLVDYFCFHQDTAKVDKAFSRFMDNPLQDLEMYLLTYKKILFYQRTELIEKTISRNFVTINDAAGLMDGGAYWLAVVKFYMSLEEVFRGGEKTIDKPSFSKKLSEYQFVFEDDFLPSFEIALLNPILEEGELMDLFKKERGNTKNIIHGYFLRYMYEKGFAFYLSGRIWGSMLDYWNDNNSSKKTMASYFGIEAESFEVFLVSFSSNMFLNNKPEMFSNLWGSVYVYEFLYKYNIISEDLFNKFIEISRKLKGKVIAQFTSELWNSNFVHTWEKPDCISETEFSEEKNIFTKSIFLKKQKFSLLRSSISEELSKIGELSNYIFEGGKDVPTIYDTSLLDNMFDVLGDNYNDKTKNKPIKTEKTVGRNDPCPCGSGKKYKKCCE